jgi:quercetin dioxygenase-like cupin family protein
MMDQNLEMLVLKVNSDRITTTPGGVMTGLAAPSVGSKELSTWRVTLPEGAIGPVHSIDHEQVWMPLSGSFTFVVNDERVVAGHGQVAVLPAGVVRQVRAEHGPAVALVCMRSGGTAAVPGSAERRPLPWAL